MIADTVELMGISHIGFGSDHCYDQPDSAVARMHNGNWRRFCVESFDNQGS